MKKLLLILFAFSCLAAAQVSAQCNPDLSITIPGVYPDSAANLDTGMVGQQYSDTIQFKVYSSVPPLTVDSVKIMGVTGLPAGFTTSSNPPGMVFAGGANGCLLISGMAPAPAQTYPLVVNLRFYASILGNPIAPIDTVADDYRIVILPANGIPSFSNTAFDVFQNVPNPFDATTQIDFTSPVAGKVVFKVFDMIGKEIINKNIEAVPGLNRNILSSRYLKPGIYFYAVTNRSKTITRKMVVTAKP